MPNPKIWPGKPSPLGATWDGSGVNFALWSPTGEDLIVAGRSVVVLQHAR